MTQTPIYFLPGTMCDKRLWQPLFETLPSSLEPINIDLPVADSFQQIIAKLSLELPTSPINLVGFSLGGYLASLLTISHPNRVAKLMVCANSPNALPAEEIEQRKKAISAVKKFGYQGIPRTKLLQMLAQENRAKTTIINTIMAMDRSGGAEKLVSQLSATTNRQDISAKLAQLSMPIRFIYGDQDTLVDKNTITQLAGNNISSTQISHCGHMSPLEAPQQLAQEIEQYFYK